MCLILFIGFKGFSLYILNELQDPKKFQILLYIWNPKGYKLMPVKKPNIDQQSIKILKQCEEEKFWYLTEIHLCVLCGREKKNRNRVHLPELSQTSYRDDICWNCR